MTHINLHPRLKNSWEIWRVLTLDGSIYNTDWFIRYWKKKKLLKFYVYGLTTNRRKETKYAD